MTEKSQPPESSSPEVRKTLGLDGFGIPDQHKHGVWFETKKFDMFADNHNHDVNV